MDELLIYQLPRYVKKDHSGSRVDKLRVITFSHKAKRMSYFWVQCDCGTYKCLPWGNVKISCGCVRRDPARAKRFGKGFYSHGMAHSRLTRILAGAVQRCHNPKSKPFKWYGGRGITVCDEWRNSVATFIAWANNNGYNPSLELDRKDNHGNYDPINCRWVSRRVNANNTRSNRLIESNGEVHTISDWARQCGVPYEKFLRRINRGWTVGEASTPGRRYVTAIRKSQIRRF